MRQLFFDSRDRISGSTCDFTIQLREQLVSTQANFFRIDELRVPLVIPLIQAGINDDIVFALTGAPKNLHPDGRQLLWDRPGDDDPKSPGRPVPGQDLDCRLL